MNKALNQDEFNFLGKRFIGKICRLMQEEKVSLSHGRIIICEILGGILSSYENPQEAMREAGILIKQVLDILAAKK